MRFGSVCSGIEAASVAWNPLGWEAAFVSEIEPFPCAVLAHHYPAVPNLGDMTKLEVERGAIDLLVGGTPCQSFSVAGLRKGLADPRGNLAFVFLSILDRARPRWVVWENVPGVLSSNKGRDFGSFLGGLGELGYGWAYRVLDAQYFGVAQRRRRVFVVGHLGDWRRAAAVLFERHSLSGYPPPSRKERSVVAALTATGVGTCGVDDNQAQAGHIIAQCLTTGTGRRYDADTETLIAYPLQEVGCPREKSQNGIGIGEPGDPMFTLQAGQQHGIMTVGSVRRLTVEECEALQGFHKFYTAVLHRGKPAADGPRYKAIGNSFAVPVVRWIGERIQAVDAAGLPARKAGSTFIKPRLCNRKSK